MPFPVPQAIISDSQHQPFCCVPQAGTNVDAKLIRNDRARQQSAHLNTTADLTDTIELANGCACACHMPLVSRIGARFFPLSSVADLWHKRHLRYVAPHWSGSAGCSLQDELFASFEQLLALGDLRGHGFDRYACPNPIREPLARMQ